MIVSNDPVFATAGRDPGSRAPAPGSLRLIQALVNTLSVEAERDLLGTPAEAAGWLQAAGLLPVGSSLTSAEHRAVVEVREAIRQVLATHTAGRADAAAARRLTWALACCRLTPAIDPAGGVRLVSADHDPVARAIGGVAIAIAEAGTAGTWARLKSCPGHLCGWAFYDRSASARARWCSMQLCGARSKMRAYRDRQPSGTKDLKSLLRTRAATSVHDIDRIRVSCRNPVEIRAVTRRCGETDAVKMRSAAAIDP